MLVFALAVVTSGTPPSWAATQEAPGVNLLTDLSAASVARIADQVARLRQPGDVVIVSIHWGPNWGYEIPDEQRRFAHAVIDQAGVSIVHGHSSHHPKAIEVYRNRLILYGCGDFLNDYEGIRGYEEFRDDLGLMYFADISSSSMDLEALEIIPLQIPSVSPHPPDHPRRRLGATDAGSGEPEIWHARRYVGCAACAILAEQRSVRFGRQQRQRLDL